MRVVVKQRPLKNHGPAECRCCVRLSWKELKFDKYALKEAVNDAHYALDVRSGKVLAP